MISGMVALPMEVVDVDEMAMLDGKPVTRACGVGEGDEIVCQNSSKRTETMRMVSATRQHT